MLVQMGHRIREARKESNWTMESLAEELGVSKQSLHLWETGKNRIEVDKLPALSRILGRSIGWFFGEEGEGSTVELSSASRSELKTALTELEKAQCRISSFLGTTRKLYVPEFDDGSNVEHLDAYGRPQPSPEAFTKGQKAARKAGELR